MLFLLAGCELLLDDGDDDAPPPPPEPVSQDASITRQVDILFIIDNSGSMDVEQERLVAAIPDLESGLRGLVGGSPDLHVGVVSTNTGATAGVASCEAAGDAGRLHNEPRAAGCTGPDGAFIAETYNADGELEINAAGTLAETLSCIAPLGTIGCGFESPLEAARLALDGRNTGFHRDEALLVLVILSDEDDCSVDRRDVFYDDVTGDSSSPLGVFSSFRCFEFGVQCASGDPRSFGLKEGCDVRRDEPLLGDVGEYVDFFQQLKGPGRTVVTSIHGLPQASPGGGFNAEVVPFAGGGTLEGSSSLAPVCGDTFNSATPAIRLESFRRAFPNAASGDICQASYDLGAVASSIEAPLSTACLRGAAAGLRCSATLTDPAGVSRSISMCREGESGCVALVDSDGVCDGGASLVLRHDASVPAGARVDVRCDAP